MALTPVEKGLVEPVRDILLRIRGTLGSKPRFDPLTATRHMSLAVIDYVADILMADVLRRARLEAPQMTFELRGVGRRATEDLESGELDSSQPCTSRSNEAVRPAVDVDDAIA
jgi:LysR family transcriptional regulator, nod-box dependent transcriptional activator